MSEHERNKPPAFVGHPQTFYLTDGTKITLEELLSQFNTQAAVVEAARDYLEANREGYKLDISFARSQLVIAIYEHDKLAGKES